MGFFLGIDGGGSKVECVLADEAGEVVARASGGGVNLGRVSADQLRAELVACLAVLQRMTGLKDLRPDAVCAGFAGASDAEARKRARGLLTELLHPRTVFVVGDMEVALEAAAGGGPGVVLIAGTGSIAYGRNRVGRVARAGGHGPEAGDKGSGYDIGRRAVEAIQSAARHGRKLDRLVMDRLGVSSVEELGAWLTPVRATELAALVPVVVEAARGGEAEAERVLAAAAESLAGLALAVLRELKLAEGPVRVSTHGGVFAASREVEAAVRARILAAAPQATVEPLRVTPGQGAVLLAQRLWAEAEAGAKR